MRHITFDPEALVGEDRAWWDAWLKRASAATAKAIEAREAGKQYEFRNEIWGELKAWLLEHVFDDKCAYCETPVTAGFVGDAEHYRPKRGVTVRNGERLDEVIWQGQPHPGYYWLAYDWRNLMPSCTRCNSARGKMTQFPVRGQHVGSHTPPPTDPDALDASEQPLILNPYRHQPLEHLAFESLGVAVARTEEGQHSIAVYDLNREKLREARQHEQESAWALARSALDRSRDDWLQFLERYKRGTPPYSAAAYSFIKQKLLAAAQDL